MKRASKTLSFCAPRPGTAAYERTFYVEKSGVRKNRFRMLEDGDDLYADGEIAVSEDNGETWTGATSAPVCRETTNGCELTLPLDSFIDETKGRFLQFFFHQFVPRRIENGGAMGVYDLGKAHSGSFLSYRVSEDGARSWAHADRALSAENLQDLKPPEGEAPLRIDGIQQHGLHAIVRTREGRLLIPVAISERNAEGRWHNPTGAPTWQAVLVLLAGWNADASLSFTPAAVLRISPLLSLRGLTEPTTCLAPDGRIILIMRGSNDSQGAMPGYKWFTTSADGGLAWGPIEHWTYADGSPLFSSSSISAFLTHSNGKIYWIGNTSPTNVSANLPRSPLVCLEIDPATLRPRRETEVVVDEILPGDPKDLQLSNFFAHEDRATHEIVIHMTRWNLGPSGPAGDSYCYRIKT